MIFVLIIFRPSKDTEVKNEAAFWINLTNFKRTTLYNIKTRKQKKQFNSLTSYV